MTTTAPSPSLAEELTERWRDTVDRAATGSSGDAIGDAVDVLGDALIAPYLVYEDDDAIKPIGNDWIRELEAAMDQAALSVWEAHVVPAVVAAVVEKLPSAPEYLREFPGSEQLRADLETLGDA